MPHDKIIPAPFTKGVNFTNWLEYRPAEEINADMFTRADFVNAQALGCEPCLIAKTMSFLVDENPVLVVLAGDARVDNAKFKAVFRHKAKIHFAGTAEPRFSVPLL